nr:aryl-sulfate sulfotransferase N-terminal domain-containing protein [Bacilli bacterium]
MKKELLSYKNLIKFILIILFFLSISFIVQYNIKEYKKENDNTSSVIKESYLFLKDVNATEIENTNDFSSELKVKNDILKKLNEDTYTIDSPLIVINPYGNSPLSAILAFNTKEEKSINVVINGEYSYTSVSSKEHLLPVFYLIPNEINKVSLNGIEIDVNVEFETNDIDN